ncbi:hypothetical protein L596_004972 [Steinernema carpocapsae]|uniref:Uncharacterized protein n=1 Tax=Steinernema carpocapsae TaxID=34508 RepID=A0A4U8V132_STECR|nr:hypothetical protein L596_004972 [Steinernema carpocapsae]
MTVCLVLRSSRARCARARKGAATVQKGERVDGDPRECEEVRERRRTRRDEGIGDDVHAKFLSPSEQLVRVAHPAVRPTVLIVYWPVTLFSSRSSRIYHSWGVISN